MGKTSPSTNQISRRRRRAASRSTRSKRPSRAKPKPGQERTYTLDKTWVSASSIRNYLLKDPLQDWLNEYGNPFDVSTNPSTTPSKSTVTSKLTVASTATSTSSTQVNLTDFLKDQGNQFEKQLIPQLFQKFGPDVILDIGGNHHHCTIVKLDETRKALSQGVPIIYSGVLHDPDGKIYGVPDLMVRSDWLGQLVHHDPLDSTESHHPAPNLNGPYHYRIVDIKFATLYLRADGTHLLNQESIPAYKGQLWVYNQILAKIQGYDPGVAYLLGRRWKYSTKGIDYRGNNCFDRLGVVDFRTGHVDFDYVAQAEAAVKWLRDVRTKGAKWNVTQEPLSRPELYPNMSNRADHPWRPVKECLAKEIGEITSLWQCGPKHRAIAHENGIFRWDDPNCTPDTVGMTGEHRRRVLGAILKINQQTHPTTLVQPQIIRDNTQNWQTQRKLEFFVDFETVNDVIDASNHLPESNSISLIFMIGVGYIDPTTQTWVYRNFTVDELTPKEEARICRQFSQFIETTCDEHGVNDPILVHWSQAEVNMWEAAAERNPRETHWIKTSNHWFDLYKVFTAEPIVIHGCLSFGLKEVAKAFHQHGLIDTLWDTTNTCQNGASAMVIAYQANNDAKRRQISMTELPAISEMVQYNEVDCKVMAEIITYLRANHTKNSTTAKAKAKPKAKATGKAKATAKSKAKATGKAKGKASPKRKEPVKVTATSTSPTKITPARPTRTISKRRQK
jgi:hypothetical protein